MKYTFKVSIRIIRVLTIFSIYWVPVHSIWKCLRHACIPVFLSLCPFVRWNKDVRLRHVLTFSIRRVWVDFRVWVRSGKCGSERPRTPSILRSVQHCDLNIPFAGTGSWDTLSVVVIRGYNAAFLWHCWFFSYFMMDLLMCEYEPFDKNQWRVWLSDER